ncbi:[4Fe-4S] cluster assembly scaffold protein Mrp (=ApbC) [hydrothermal vent metagenome]|uniref:[4Fe-4S] cluster assembly scaffold protein Mrp (=ApbC) n=1 Tax=hydrothermal vent metagenome TaxID=652676 RepID=A0A3B0R2X1_9ZZZZ
MSEITKEQVLAALTQVKGPDLEGDIVSRNMVTEVVITGGNIMFGLLIDPAKAKELEPMRQAAERAVSEIEGVDKVMVALTAEKAPSSGNGTKAPVTRGSKTQGAAPASGAIAGVKHLVAIASGKGGVGKSTTAINVALGLVAMGLKVGILDADVYGPSLPRLVGHKTLPQQDPLSDGKLQATEAYGLKVMSMGFLVEEDTPMIWRGPMVQSALQQMLNDVEWGELDIMIIDMPPGTGDAQLSMAQQTPLAGAVIVSTPQDLSLIDARKGLNMFLKVSVPVLGIIENMSYFICDSCDKRHEIFGHGGARAEAEKLDLPFLGEIPLDIKVRERSDSGEPIVASDPDSMHAGIYKDIAKKVWEAVDGTSAAPSAGPKIVIE